MSFAASDRGGLERLCRYVLRRGDWGATGLRARALALGRLERLPDGRVFLGFKRGACPHCNKPMTLRSIVIREPATTKVVSGLLRSTGPPAAA